MRGFTPVYRQGHDLLLPTRVNDKAKVFFLIDTGSAENMISLEAATQYAKVWENDAYKVRGISGEVKRVFRAEDVTLQFANFKQRMDTMLCLDMTKLSNNTGTELSGIFGFAATAYDGDQDRLPGRAGRFEIRSETLLPGHRLMARGVAAISAYWNY
jgi:hypothetical protein